jgi:hypothetical protein
MINRLDGIDRMTIDLGHDQTFQARHRGKASLDPDYLVAAIDSRRKELGVINQAVPDPALVYDQVVAPEQVHLTGSLEPGQVEDIFVGLGNSFWSNVREGYLLLHIDLWRRSLGLGVFVRHEQTSGLHSQFLGLALIAYDGREQICRVQIATGFEPGKEFFSSSVPGSGWASIWIA